MATRAARWGGVAAVALAAVSAVALAAGGDVTVRAVRADVLSEPDLLSDRVGTVKRGEVLPVVAISKAQRETTHGYWTKVRLKGQEGWLPRSAILEGRKALSEKAGGEGSGASADEVELAGRGFTPEIEDKFKREQGAQVQQALEEIDAIQKVAVDPKDAKAFKAGAR